MVNFTPKIEYNLKFESLSKYYNPNPDMQSHDLRG